MPAQVAHNEHPESKHQHSSKESKEQNSESQEDKEQAARQAAHDKAAKAGGKNRGQQGSVGVNRQSQQGLGGPARADRQSAPDNALAESATGLPPSGSPTVEQPAPSTFQPSAGAAPTGPFGLTEYKKEGTAISPDGRRTCPRLTAKRRLPLRRSNPLSNLHKTQAQVNRNRNWR